MRRSTGWLVVIVSANTEWRCTKEYFPGLKIQITPLGEYFETTVGGTPIVFFHGGWGKIAAAASAQFVIDYWHPSWIINLGTCGGFDGQVERGEIVLARETLVYDVVERMGDAQEALDFYTTRLDSNWPARKFPIPVREARLISADQDIDPNQVEYLASHYLGVAADWESGAIAWTATRNQVRCLILRGVSDLVSGGQGEAYGNWDVFVNGTQAVMNRLLGCLPAWVEWLTGDE